MSYTTQDVDNAIEYSNQRLSLKFLNLMYNKYPHLTSYVEYELKQADPDNDYYYTESFKPWAITMHTKVNSILCEKISCNSAKETTACRKSDGSSYYRVGTDQFERNCEPACFNLVEDPAFDEETGEEQTHMVRTNYHNDKCIIVPPGLIWHELPFYRSNEVYEQRMNDLPLGFNRDVDLPYTYSGRNYKYNKLYCDAYYDQWSEEKQTCITTVWERILYAVVGESITKMVKAGIDGIQSGPPSGYELPPDLPDYPPIDIIWTVDGWKKDINYNFILPPEDFTITGSGTTIFRECKQNENVPLEKDIFRKRLDLLKTLKRKERSLASALRRKIEREYTPYIVLTNEEEQQIYTVKEYNKKFPGTNHGTLSYENLKFKKNKKLVIRPAEGEDTGEDDSVGFFEELGNIIGGILASMGTPEFWVDVGIGELSEAFIKQIKKVALKLADELIPKLTTIILKTTTEIFSNVFMKSLLGTISQCATKIFIKSVSKIMIQLAKLMAEIASVVGIILAILTIMDIILTIWDPLNFNSKFDEEVIASVCQNSDEALRMDLEVAVPEVNFDLFTNIVLSPDDILNVCVTSFTDIYLYLDSLTINSEGSRIVKGFELDVSDLDPEGVLNQGVVASKKIKPSDLYLFEKDHALRMRFFKNSKKPIYLFFGISAVLLILEYYLFALLFFLLTLGIVFLSYLNTININVGKYTQDFLKLLYTRI
ncbi:P74 [Dikerogammarus haemobaphes nudivirus]|nr:P74 [Dikerogammarus haemobaphes nudivirus]